MVKMASLFHCPGVACEEMCDKSLPNSLVLLELELMFILRCLDGPYAAPLRHSSHQAWFSFPASLLVLVLCLCGGC